MKDIEKYLKQAEKIRLLIDKQTRLIEIVDKIKGDLNFLIITPMLGGFCGILIESKLGTHWFADFTFWSLVIISIGSLILNIPKRKELNKARKDSLEIFNEYKKEKELFFSLSDEIKKEELYYFIDKNYTKLTEADQECLDDLAGYFGSAERKKEQVLKSLQLSTVGVTIDND